MLKPGAIPLNAFLGVTALFSVVALAVGAHVRPLNLHTGYAPSQPIDYSHRLHAGELGISCLYCHFGARTSRNAGIPPTSVCLRCHVQVSAPFEQVQAERERARLEGREPARIVSPEIEKLYRAAGLDRDLQPLPEGPVPIPWVRVHNLPDFVAFDHSVHVARGVSCESCHGPVHVMERVRQEHDLSMGWCLDCHRKSPMDPGIVLRLAHGRLPPGQHVSTDCSSCHF